jgi:hypothetical protein
VSDAVRILMFPSADHSPASRYKSGICLNIPLPVSNNLRIPIVAIGRRPLIVLRAAVPEAAIDEYGYLGPGKDDIRGSA